MAAVRAMHDSDVFGCLNVDPGYVTDRAYRLDRQDSADAVSFSLRPFNLPRPKTVEGYPIAPALDDRLARADLALVLEDDDVLGYLLVAVVDRTARIDLIVVDPAWRRQGLGGRLFGDLRRWARDRGLRWIEAAVETSNYPAARFFCRQGLDIVGVRDDVGQQGGVFLLLAGPVGSR